MLNTHLGGYNLKFMKTSPRRETLEVELSRTVSEPRFDRETERWTAIQRKYERKRLLRKGNYV